MPKRNGSYFFHAHSGDGNPVIVIAARLVREKRGRADSLQTIQNGHWIAGDRKIGLAKLLTDLKRRFGEIDMPGDHMQAIFRFDKGFKTSLPQRSDWESGLPPAEADVTIYTDGSKTNDGTGAGVYSEDLRCETFQNLGTHATVFQSEVVAICEGSRELIR